MIEGQHKDPKQQKGKCKTACSQKQVEQTTTTEPTANKTLEEGHQKSVGTTQIYSGFPSTTTTTQCGKVNLYLKPFKYRIE